MRLSWRPVIECEEEPGILTYAEYGKLVTEKILEVVQQAMYGSTNRDDFIGMEEGEDSGVDLMFSFDRSGQPTGAIVNVACPSQVMEATYKYPPITWDTCVNCSRSLLHCAR